MKVSLNRTDDGKQTLFDGILVSSIVFPWDLAFTEVNILLLSDEDGIPSGRPNKQED